MTTAKEEVEMVKCPMCLGTGSYENPGDKDDFGGPCSACNREGKVEKWKVPEILNWIDQNRAWAISKGMG